MKRSFSAPRQTHAATENKTNAPDKQGEYCARRPLRVIGAGALLVALCLLGLLRFRLETDPQRLWAGAASRAARDRAAFEAAFGPFYRVAQLIVTTTPAAAANFTSPGSGLPAVVTEANLRLLFDMQDAVDAISGARGALRLCLGGDGAGRQERGREGNTVFPVGLLSNGA